MLVEQDIVRSVRRVAEVRIFGVHEIVDQRLQFRRQEQRVVLASHVMTLR